MREIPAFVSSRDEKLGNDQRAINSEPNRGTPPAQDDGDPGYAEERVNVQQVADPRYALDVSRVIERTDALQARAQHAHRAELAYDNDRQCYHRNRTHNHCSQPRRRIARGPARYKI